MWNGFIVSPHINEANAITRGMVREYGGSILRKPNTLTVSLPSGDCWMWADSRSVRDSNVLRGHRFNRFIICDGNDEDDIAYVITMFGIGVTKHVLAEGGEVDYRAACS